MSTAGESPLCRRLVIRERRHALRTLKRDPSYFVVVEVALSQEMGRLRELPAFTGGPLAVREPELKVRRARRRPNRLGFAVPTQFRLSVTAYPGIRAGDILETLLHELVHLHVGRAAERHAWHGETFRRTLARAMEEGYGVVGPSPRSTAHGVYAVAIERARRTSGEPLQMQI
jgi:hypothetical protein